MVAIRALLQPRSVALGEVLLIEDAIPGHRLGELDAWWFKPSASGVQGLLLYEIGRYDAAADAYRRHFAGRIARGETTFDPAEDALLGGDETEARSLLDAARTAGDPDWLVMRAAVELRAAAGNVDAIVATFEPAGTFREPSGGIYVHRGQAAVRAFMTQILAAGGIGLEHATVTDDGVVTALEFNAVSFGPRRLTPQAGLAVYERGPTGRLAAARIYDDINVEELAPAADSSP